MQTYDDNHGSMQGMFMCATISRTEEQEAEDHGSYD